MNDLIDTGKDTSRSCIFDYPDRPDRPTPPTDGDGHPIPDYPYTPADDWPHFPEPVPPEDRRPPGVPPHGRKVGTRDTTAFLLGRMDLLSAIMQLSFTASEDFIDIASGGYSYEGPPYVTGTNDTQNFGPSNAITLRNIHGVSMSATLDIDKMVAGYPAASMITLHVSAVAKESLMGPFVFIPHSGTANATGEVQHNILTGTPRYTGFQGTLYYWVPTRSIWSDIVWRTDDP